VTNASRHAEDVTIATVNVQAADPGALPANAMQGLPANAVSDYTPALVSDARRRDCSLLGFIAWLVFGVGCEAIALPLSLAFNQ